MKTTIYNISILLFSVLCFIGCSNKEEVKDHEGVDIDFGEGTYRPTPFELDNVIPFSWMGMPDSVKKETEIEISFNEDAVRSNSTSNIFLVDSKGNRIDGVKIGKNQKDDLTVKAGKQKMTIPISYIVDPEVGDSLLTGSVMVAGDKLDEVNNTELMASATPVATWSLNHQTGINFWRWALLLILAILALVILYFILKYIILLLKELWDKRPRRERKPRRRRRKEPKPFKMNIALYQWLLPRIYDLPPVLFHISYFFLPNKIKKFLKDTNVAWMPYNLWHRGELDLSIKESIISLFKNKSGIFKLRYKHGEIDFEPVSLGKIKLPLCRLHGCIPKNAINPRPKVYIAQEIAAEKFIKSRKGRHIIAKYVGKNKNQIDISDFTSWKDDSKNQGKKKHNPLTPHETSDGAYILYVPKKYHDVGWGGLSHNGGVHYLKKFRAYVDRKNKERQEQAFKNSY